MNDESRNVIRGLRGAKDKSFGGPRFGKFRSGRYRTWADWYGLGWFCGCGRRGSRRRNGRGNSFRRLRYFSRSGMAVPEQTETEKQHGSHGNRNHDARIGKNILRGSYGPLLVSLTQWGRWLRRRPDARGIAGYAWNGRVLRLERIDVLGFVSHAGLTAVSLSLSGFAIFCNGLLRCELTLRRRSGMRRS